jgi:outer membrane lipoprotein-sorting protein
MNKQMTRSMVVLMVIFGFPMMLSAQVPADAEDLLRQADNTLAPSDIRFNLRMENLRDGKVHNWSSLDCYSSGVDKFLMVYQAPAIVVGQAQLKVDDTIFIYNRKVDRITRTSARANFFGSLFSQEDVMSSRLSSLYTIQSVSTVKIGQQDAIQLTLIGKIKDVAYGEIRLFLDASSKMPLRREYYAFSGQKIKELTVDKLELDATGLPTRIELTMNDTIRRGQATKAVMSNFDRSPIPSNYFTRNYLRIITQ